MVLAYLAQRGEQSAAAPEQVERPATAPARRFPPPVLRPPGWGPIMPPRPAPMREAAASPDQRLA